MKSFLVVPGLVVLLAITQVAQGSFIKEFPQIENLIATSLVLLEAAVPAPETLTQI